MCLICERIKMIKEGTNPYFVRELKVLPQISVNLTSPVH